MGKTAQFHQSDSIVLAESSSTTCAEIQPPLPTDPVDPAALFDHIKAKALLKCRRPTFDVAIIKNEQQPTFSPRPFT